MPRSPVVGCACHRNIQRISRYHLILLWSLFSKLSKWNTNHSLWRVHAKRQKDSLCHNAPWCAEIWTFLGHVYMSRLRRSLCSKQSATSDVGRRLTIHIRYQVTTADRGIVNGTHVKTRIKLMIVAENVFTVMQCGWYKHVFSRYSEYSAT